MTLFPEVVIATTSADASAAVTWDLDTGTQLASFKQCSAPANGLALLGADYFIAPQQQKDALHTYAWFKEAIHQRSFASEKLTAVTTAPSGGFIAAGGASGTLYIWATSSGRLLLAHKAHFQAITCLRFTDHQGHLLFSGGRDSIVSCWEVIKLLDASATPHSVQPRWSKAVHALPVTGLAVGSDACTPCVVTSSLDCTCRVWNGASGHLTRTIRLAHPAQCVALTWLETAVFIGLADGTIAHASVTATEQQMQAVEDAALDAAAAEESQQPAQASACMVFMRGHTGAVTCVSQSGDGLRLCSGSVDGSVRVWDIPSHQCIRTLRKPCAAPITNVITLSKPPHLHVSGASRGGGSGGAAQDSRKQLRPKRLAPLAPLCKFPGPSSTLRPWEDGVAVIHGAHDVAMHGLHACGRERLSDATGLAAACRTMQGVVPGEGWGAARGAGGGAGGLPGGATGRGALEEAETEAAALKDELERWKRKYAELYEVSYDALGLDAAT
eukprot:jgi/Ulvmu1/5839/UM025_0097.1